MIDVGVFDRRPVVYEDDEDGSDEDAGSDYEQKC